MNPDDAVIVSIPYSGTRYLRKALKIPKCVHTYVGPERLLEYVGNAKLIVVPLRKPESNWKAWARRWPEGKPWDRRIAEFERAWMGMAWFLEYMDSYYNSNPASRQVLRIYPDYNFPSVEGVPREGADDEGANEYDYDVSHLYMNYKFVTDYYKPGVKI